MTIEDKAVLADKVLAELVKNEVDTVPEIFMGYDQFPSPNSKEDHLYRIIEQLIVDAGLAVIKTTNPNARIMGYYDLTLTSKGMEILYDDQSCLTALKDIS